MTGGSIGPPPARARRQVGCRRWACADRTASALTAGSWVVTCTLQVTSYALTDEGAFHGSPCRAGQRDQGDRREGRALRGRHRKPMARRVGRRARQPASSSPTRTTSTATRCPSCSPMAAPRRRPSRASMPTATSPSSAVDTGVAPAHRVGRCDAGERRPRSSRSATRAGQGPRASFGFVSGIGRSFRGPRGRRVTGALEHTAPLLPGSSGGPVVNPEGQLLGINTNRLGEGFYQAIGADATLRERVERADPRRDADAASAGRGPRPVPRGAPSAPRGGAAGSRRPPRSRRRGGLPGREGGDRRGRPARGGRRQGDRQRRRPVRRARGARRRSRSPSFAAPTSGRSRSRHDLAPSNVALMDERVQAALARGGVIDITTTGRPAVSRDGSRSSSTASAAAGSSAASRDGRGAGSRTSAPTRGWSST